MEFVQKFKCYSVVVGIKAKGNKSNICSFFIFFLSVFLMVRLPCEYNEDARRDKISRVENKHKEIIFSVE